jgi:DNA-binding winged helix-turn-helix (wHTH) protein
LADVTTVQTASDQSQTGTGRRFRFGEFVLSPRQRVLCRNGVPLALIPRYFDLLHLLVVRRRDAVSKATIFVEVWTDVVVSDGALAQAVRTLRRTLGDDSREPRFIRTVSRHGYQFVCTDISEEEDDGLATTGSAPRSASIDVTEALESLVDRLVAATATRPSVGDDGDEARDLAERLHALGTDAALSALASRPGHARAIAVMKDARWYVAGARDVPLLSDPEALRSVLAVVRLRLHQVRQTIAARWASAAGAGALGGAVAGALGGTALWLSPMSSARPQSSLALAILGLLAGGFGAAGVAAGLAAAEALARSRRGLALALCGAASGAVTGALGHVVLRVLLDSLFGLQLLTTGGVVDGLALGAAAGLGYGWASRQPPGGGIAAPTGGKRLAVVVIVGAACAAAAVGLALAGRPLVGGLIHQIAQASRDSQLGLAPLGRLIGEPDFGPVAQTLLAALEGGTFGGTLAWGLTRRSRASTRR